MVKKRKKRMGREVKPRRAPGNGKKAGKSEDKTLGNTMTKRRWKGYNEWLGY